ncbi:hypothetical protein LJK88_38595 [Paenibacillus sp. P26]|nr:hypothetical protein LJK88_38595 [Paenibacillus sp. P26]UUZ93167.1 hypothetical protein LJK87_49710 [Paenibacillus sp. P25]
MTRMNGDTLIVGAKIVTPGGIFENGYASVRQGSLESVGPLEDLGEDGKKGAHTVDAQGGWSLPGFIDVHVHGGYGYDFMDADSGGLDEITGFHARNGTTAMLATTVTASREAIDRVLARVQAYRRGKCLTPSWPACIWRGHSSARNGPGRKIRALLCRRRRNGLRNGFQPIRGS